MRHGRASKRMLALLGALLLWPCAAGITAQDDDSASDDNTEDEKDPVFFAIEGGDVYTGTGAVLRGATVLARDGKIAEIGYDIHVPEDAERLDARGLRVYPGLIALGATSRVSGGTMAAEEPVPDEFLDESDAPEELQWDGLGHALSLVTGQSHVGLEPHDLQADEGKDEKKSGIEDSFDPFNPYLVLALATGITSVQQSSATIKLKRYEIDGILLRDRYLATVPWTLSNPTGIKSTRKKFAKASGYLRELRAWRARKDKDEKEPSKKGVDTTALKVLSGESAALFRATRREELLGIARFAQEFGFRPVIEGCDEGWTVAAELGRAGAYAILMPRHRLPKQESFTRPGGSSIENAAILHASGVQIAIRTDNTSIDVIGTAGRDLLALPVEAGFAIRGGLDGQAALEALTIVPARLLGVQERIGSLEVGKDCDAIVTDGDLLHYKTFVQYAVVDGKLVYDKEEEVYFAHIRPRPEREEDEQAQEPGEPEDDGSTGEGETEGEEEDSGEEEDQ